MAPELKKTNAKAIYIEHVNPFAEEESLNNETANLSSDSEEENIDESERQRASSSRRTINEEDDSTSWEDDYDMSSKLVWDSGSLLQKGLFKKALELFVFCEAFVPLIVFFTNGLAMRFSPPTGWIDLSDLFLALIFEVKSKFVIGPLQVQEQQDCNHGGHRGQTHGTFRIAASQSSAQPVNNQAGPGLGHKLEPEARNNVSPARPI
ncbi:hypothetical protein EJ110_NYTH41927 [Nymphaea thermarum]|nr:hypothetical protein EJ110_NYTH41927 [Nymphaea thermarum]